MSYKITKNDKQVVELAIKNLKEKTKKEYIDISYDGSKEQLSLFISKIGNIPYLPKEMEVPLDSRGEQLSFLAQINCEELPKNSLYPEKGLIQFWIGRDELFGLEDKEKGYRVLYFDKIDKTVKTEDVLKKYKLLDPKNNNEHSPITRKTDNFEITHFIVKNASIGTTVYNFEQKLFDELNALLPDRNVENFWEDIETSVAEDILDQFDNLGTIIGGYPFFSQYDPRERLEKNYDVVLFQLGEYYGLDAGMEIIWGDDGIGNFLISKEDLENLNFDDVLYTWDCF